MIVFPILNAFVFQRITPGFKGLAGFQRDLLFDLKKSRAGDADEDEDNADMDDIATIAARVFPDSSP
jgi:hypothetical protein